MRVDKSHVMYFGIFGQVSMEAEADVEDIITREDGVVEVPGWAQHIAIRNDEPWVIGHAACCEFHPARDFSDTFWLAKRTGKR